MATMHACMNIVINHDSMNMVAPLASVGPTAMARSERLMISTENYQELGRGAKWKQKIILGGFPSLSPLAPPLLNNKICSYETMNIKRPIVPECTFVTGKDVPVSVSSCTTFVSGLHKDEDGMG